ncbi:MAG: ProQ/FinO family protein [Rubrivivax sp.]
MSSDPLPETDETPAAVAPASAARPLSNEACAGLLKQHFPALFAGTPKPLKLRIQADIQVRAPGVFTKSALSAFFRQHTGRNAYLLALTRAEQRFDLDGQAAGELSAEHRQAAVDELARRRGLRESREALLQEQRRNRATLLRDFESNTLTVANFCTLKGVAPDDLEGLLEQARAEAREPSAGPQQAPRTSQRQRRA